MRPVVEALRTLPDPQRDEPMGVDVLELPGHGNTPLADESRFQLADFVDVMADAGNAVGSKDETVTVQEAQEAARVMSQGQCVVLDNVGHPIERTPVARIVDLVRDMLTERGPATSL